MTSVDADPSYLRTVLSTVTSPLPLNIMVVYQHYDVGYMLLRPEEPFPLACLCPKGDARVALRHQQRFKELHGMYMVRRFQLVLCADVLDRVTEHTTQALECVVNTEKAKGGFDYLFHEPLIISEARSPYIHLWGLRAGSRRRSPLRDNAL